MSKKSHYAKLLFALLGAAGLFLMVRNYGMEAIRKDLTFGYQNITLLILTFIPTLFCYSSAWYLVTDHFAGKGLFLFTRFTAASITWNNLTPFLKVGGEPLKIFLLENFIARPKAVESVLIYNFIHTLATGLSFVIAAIGIPLLFNAGSEIKLACFVFAMITSMVIMAGCLLPVLWQNSFGEKDHHKRTWLHKISVSANWAIHQTRIFITIRPLHFYLAIVLEILARFIEGLTFYLAFILIKHPVTFLASAFLDVGRTLSDTIFFFIPYQLGSREQSTLLLMDKVMGIRASGYLTAVFLYRFVEIVWAIIGYLCWINLKRAKRS